MVTWYVVMVWGRRGTYATREGRVGLHWSYVGGGTEVAGRGGDDGRLGWVVPATR